MRKILIIDDDIDFLEIISVYLKEKEYTVETASNPEEGLQKTQSVQPDLVVLDVMMPEDFEGFEVARNIREKLALTDLPIIILSCIHDRKKVPYRFAPDKEYLPVDVFLDKPVRPETLLEKIEELLGERRVSPDQIL